MIGSVYHLDDCSNSAPAPRGRERRPALARLVCVACVEGGCFGCSEVLFQIGNMQDFPAPADGFHVNCPLSSLAQRQRGTLRGTFHGSPVISELPDSSKECSSLRVLASHRNSSTSLGLNVGASWQLAVAGLAVCPSVLADKEDPAEATMAPDKELCSRGGKRISRGCTGLFKKLTLWCNWELPRKNVGAEPS